MSAAVAAPVAKPPARAPARSPAVAPPQASSFVQRKCACGAAAVRTGAGGDCPDCARKKRLGVQTKLAVGASNDPLEAEADRVADQVLSGPPPGAALARAPARLQRAAPGADAGGGQAPASVESVLASAGTPLAPPLRREMEARFGHDFGQVRIHADAAAARSARDIEAHAYTSGAHIAFAAGAFAPHSAAGRRLLAHELAHVVQQGGSGGAPATDGGPAIARAWNNCAVPSTCPPREAGEVAAAARRPWLVGELVTPERGQMVAHFDIGSANAASLAGNADWVRLVGAITRSDQHWELLGFTDCEGTEARNQALRQRRADAVAALLPAPARAKIDAVRAADPTDCVADNSTSDHRAVNRSVVFKPTVLHLDFEEETITGTPHPYVCGPDVTAKVQGAVTGLRSTFAGWNAGQKSEACDALDSWRYGACAWDIVELHNNAWIHQNYRPACATQGATPPCGETVQVGSECYYAGSPNYVIFGTMCQLCAQYYLSIPLINTGYARFTRASMDGLIDLYKGRGFTGLATPSGNYRESLAWARAGYAGWPSGGTPPRGDRPNCAPVCPTPYTGSMRVHWYPNLPLETCG